MPVIRISPNKPINMLGMEMTRDCCRGDSSPKISAKTGHINRRETTVATREPARISHTLSTISPIEMTATATSVTALAEARGLAGTGGGALMEVGLSSPRLGELADEESVGTDAVGNGAAAGRSGLVPPGGAGLGGTDVMGNQDRDLLEDWYASLFLAYV
jgi:hypothetical protein